MVLPQCRSQNCQIILLPYWFHFLNKYLNSTVCSAISEPGDSVLNYNVLATAMPIFIVELGSDCSAMKPISWLAVQRCSYNIITSIWLDHDVWDLVIWATSTRSQGGSLNLQVILLMLSFIDGELRNRQLNAQKDVDDKWFALVQTLSVQTTL